jgi:hypothetical protein
MANRCSPVRFPARAALLAKLHRLAWGGRILGFLTGGNAPHFDGAVDHIGWALLAALVS